MPIIFLGLYDFLKETQCNFIEIKLALIDHNKPLKKNRKKKRTKSKLGQFGFIQIFVERRQIPGFFNLAPIQMERMPKTILDKAQWSRQAKIGGGTKFDKKRLKCTLAQFEKMVIPKNDTINNSPKTSKNEWIQHTFPYFFLVLYIPIEYAKFLPIFSFTCHPAL